VDRLLQDLLKGDTRALSRIITRVENRSADSLDILRQLFRHTGKSQIIGVTGSPGSGKSTLVDRLAAEFRKKTNTVGIIAVDPSSPFWATAFACRRWVSIRASTFEAWPHAGTLEDWQPRRPMWRQ